MKISKVLLLVFILCTNYVFSQKSFAIDTPYTVNGTFLKEIKKFPFIKIAHPPKPDNVIEKREIVYKEIKNRKLHLDAFYANSKNLNPAVILLHGGGWISGNKSHVLFLAQEIASKGYACFAIEYRLSPEAKYPAGIYDVKSAIQFVKANAKKFKIDASKVAVLGCSSGGQMAALIGTTNNNKLFEEVVNKYNQSASVQAIINLDGISAFKHPESQEGKLASFWLGGNFEEKPAVWIQASPLTHTDKNTPPILFIGSQYPRFLAGKDDMIKILDNFKIWNQVEKFNDSPHSFWLFNPWFDDTVKYITTFLDKTLKERKNKIL